MKNKLLKAGLCALALSLSIPAVPAAAQEINSIYFTPKIIYSHQKGDPGKGKWHNGGWVNSTLGGEEEDDTFTFGAALGVDMGYYYDLPVRVEAEYIYHGKAEFSQGPTTVLLQNGNVGSASHSFKVKAHSLMANAFYDFQNDSLFTPYLGFGLGLAYLDTKYKANTFNGGSYSGSTSHDQVNFAWNVGGGVAYSFSDTMALDLGYRYLDLGEAKTGSITQGGFSGSNKIDYTAHQFSVGVRFSGF